MLDIYVRINKETDMELVNVKILYKNKMKTKQSLEYIDIYSKVN